MLGLGDQGMAWPQGLTVYAIPEVGASSVLVPTPKPSNDLL